MDYPASVPNVGLVNGKFANENAASGVVGSLVPAEWGNSVTDEILNVIKAGNLSPSESDLGQLLKAIKAVVQGLSPTFANDFAASLSPTGYIKFPAVVGGAKKTLILQWVTQSSVGTGGKVDSFPIAFPSAVLIEWATVSVTGGPLTQYAACVSPPSLTTIQTVVNTGNASVASFALGI